MTPEVTKHTEFTEWLETWIARIQRSRVALATRQLEKAARTDEQDCFADEGPATLGNGSARVLSKLVCKIQH